MFLCQITWTFDKKKIMKENSIKLIEDLKSRVKKAKLQAQSFENLSIEQLNWKGSKSSWSILECLEHLNMYGDFYLKEIEDKMLSSQHNESVEIFKSGLFGNYFANALAAKNGAVQNKMKSPKDKVPDLSKLDKKTVRRFIQQQDRMLSLLDQGKKVNLMKIKTGLSITTLIKTRLGDTFRFVIYHIERHMVQANNALEAFQQLNKTESA